MLGTGEIILIVLVILIVFGPKQLPKMSKNIGKAIKDFKKGLEI